MRTVDFYFDFGSPAAYLAWTQLPQIVLDMQAALALKRILLGGIFQATGNRPPISVPLKGQYLFTDLYRFARRYGVPLVLNPHFPVNTLMLMRVTVGLQLRGDERLADYCTAMFKAIWVDGLNMGDVQVASQVLAQDGFDPAALLALCNETDVKEHLKTLTQQAVNRGVFGAPTFFVGEHMFWGQDRLDFVREALQ
jgi:2-hydroxychromene-2-carboxylate isomerase